MDRSSIRVHPLRLAPGQSLALPADKATRLLVLRSGVARLEAGGAQLMASPQRSVWLPRSADYRLDCVQGTVAQLLIPALMPSHVPEGLHCVQPTPLLLALLDELAETRAPAVPCRRHRAITSLLRDELGHLHDFEDSFTMPRDPRLRRICQAILANPANGLRLDELARGAGLSRRTLVRLSQRELGQGLASWRRQIRVKTAAAHLAHGVPVTRAANEVGYSDQASFRREFRRVLGVQPSQFRPGQARGRP